MHACTPNGEPVNQPHRTYLKTQFKPASPVSVSHLSASYVVVTLRWEGHAKWYSTSAVMKNESAGPLQKFSAKHDVRLNA